MRIFWISLFFFGFHFLDAQESLELDVLSESAKGVAPDRELEAHLMEQLNRSLAERREKFAEVKTRGEAVEWQRERREFMIRQLGGIPERGPVSAKVTRQLQGDGYRIENLLIKGRPGFHISANLYLPDREGPFPAVLIPCGHSHNGKAAGHYQRASILMAKNGMAALCYDPIGQGERYQIIDRAMEQEYFSGLGSRKLEVPHPAVQYLCTVEHTVIGLSSILLGANTAQHRVRDGMTCIDYLQSREDILADKIGCTGNSGGGTMTAYLMVLDDRITAAAPGCYLTTFEKLLPQKGAQDAEQNIHGQIAFGLDQPDYVIMRAPKPTAILASTRDATFDIEGTWDLFRQSKEFYTLLGFSERVEMMAAAAPHGFCVQHRETAARFMHRWLLGEDRVIREFEEWPEPVSDGDHRDLGKGEWEQEELFCSPDGQVLLMEGERSIFEFNAEAESGLRESRSESWSQASPDEKREIVGRAIGLAEIPVSDVEDAGMIERSGYSIQKLVIHPESGVRLPGLLFSPENPDGRATLYLHGTSLKADAAPGGLIEELVLAGKTVLTVDLRGIGETRTDGAVGNWARGIFGPNLQPFFMAYLGGKSFVGLRAADILMSAGHLLSEVGAEKVDLVAEGVVAIPALHASAVHPELFASLELSGEIQTWQDFLDPSQSWDQAINVVHGALRHYDLPDLVELARSAGLEVKAPAIQTAQPSR